MLLGYLKFTNWASAIWDLFMDFSLLQPSSRHRGLRDILALKNKWLYYFILVADPVLRFSWIFYAIFTHNTQHSTIVSFMVAFAEVTRRGLWSIFRVENEHCSNVSQYKASRDVPLPYRIEPLIGPASTDGVPGSRDTDIGGLDESRQATATATGVDLVEEGTTRQRPDTRGSVKRNFSKILADAHRQDFEKRRKPVEGSPSMDVSRADYDDDEDDDADGQSLIDVSEAEELRRRASRTEQEIGQEAAKSGRYE